MSSELAAGIAVGRGEAPQKVDLVSELSSSFHTHKLNYERAFKYLDVGSDGGNGPRNQCVPKLDRRDSMDKRQQGRKDRKFVEDHGGK